MKYLNIRQKTSAVALLAIIFSCNAATAQEIASLPSDPAVSSGVLPNGTKWYVASNPYVQGTADFAVVQLTGAETIPGTDRETVVGFSREALGGQPGLLSPSVQEYFISKGSVPGPEGFAEVNGYTTVFRFRNVNLKLSETVLDSTLLVLTNIVGRSCDTQGPLPGNWYAPADQAIIVAGDVDAGTVSEKLKMLSYMVPFAESEPREEYKWTEQEGVAVEYSPVQVDSLAEVRVSWRLQRTPKELMNTVMPAIYAKYMTMAGSIACRRILAEFREMDLPVASVEGRYTGGAGTLGDEKFSISVKTAAEHVQTSVAAVADVMSSIVAHGADINEVRTAGYAFADRLYAEDEGSDVRNQEYLDRCIYSFVYNTPLSSKKDIRKFHASRDLDDATEASLFRSIVSSSIGGDRNLTLTVDRNVPEDVLKSVFKSSWNGRPWKNDTIRPMPYLMFPDVSAKIRSQKNEYLSGGTVMTLSNGIRIIYRNMPTEDGMLHYSLSLSGGAGNVEGLCSEDGGYLEDFFASCRIGGVPGHVFREAVRRQGMTMDCKIGNSCTEFRGMIPEDRLDYLFRALLTAMNSREADYEEWEYYLKGEHLRQTAGCASGHSGCLPDGFAGNADKFFRTLSEKVNDGIIVLVGDIDEKCLREVAKTYAGGFRTSDRAFARTETYSQGVTGKSGEYRKGKAGSVEINISAPMPLTAENYYASAMASMVLRRNLSMASAGMGTRVRVAHECRRHPQEILSVTVSLSESSAEGFSSETSGYSWEGALAAVRRGLSDVSEIQMDDEMLNSYRYRLERHLQLEKEKPEYWLEAIRLRYMEGKDFTTGAEAKIKAIGEAEVRKILSSLYSGTKIEYTITER